MHCGNRRLNLLLAAALCAGLSDSGLAKGYSSGGGHSYSSHSSSSHSSGFSSSRSSSAGSSSRTSSGSNRSSGTGNKSFSSSSGKNYSSGSTWNDNNRKGYSSSKSYTSDSGKTFRSSSPAPNHPGAPATPRKDKPDTGGFAYDTAAARARKEEASKEQFAQHKQSQAPKPVSPDLGRLGSGSPSDQGPRPLVTGNGGGPYRRRIYVPDAITLSTRPVRIYNVFNPYYGRPWIAYNDPYNSLFWWWLLDRSFDDRAWWAYHHRYDMDPARYQALMATDAQLEARVNQLEAQQVARDPGYVPPALEGRDLMYSDRYVHRAYSNRPTRLGVVAFWLLGIPLALVVCGFFIWLIWFKRWQTAT